MNFVNFEIGIEYPEKKKRQELIGKIHRGEAQPIDYREDRDIGGGSWVLVKTKIPVSESVRPMTYGIYWAIPAYDSFGRQKIKVYTPEECCLLNYEYIVLTEEMLDMYRRFGYYLHETGAKESADPMTLKIVEAGRSLVEEEREIIYALMIDGLDETAACEEYFMTKHTDTSNISICYLPTEELLDELVFAFGEDGIPG